MAHMAPSGKLLRKLLVATLGPTVAAMGVVGFLAHRVASRTLEEDLGRRLGVAAAGAALTVLPDQIDVLDAGDEESRTYTRLRAQIEGARRQLGLRRVAVVARDLGGRADTEGRIALGARAHELGADAVEMERAAAAFAPAASPLFWGHDALPYKRAYAPVGAPGAVAGFVVVEGSADYFASLAEFRRWMLAAGALGLGAVVIVTVFLARHLTGPLRRLAQAADRIGRGDLAAPVPVETRDEVGALAARLEEMRGALRARDERLQMMLAGIAHEVRNPLGGLELYAGLLRESLAGAPERLAEVARIEREVGYLKNVVTDFLEYARRPPPVLEGVPLRPLLEEAAEVAGGDAGALTIEAEPALAAAADRQQLRRALVNLIRNALAAAGAQGRVIVAARRAGGGDPGGVVVEVRDSGPGVPDDLREKVFDPFFTTRQQGTGLGLAFVREIARDHGGDVEIDRAPEGGACFRLRLRVA
jgi:signal transduction histidine kinase